MPLSGPRHADLRTQGSSSSLWWPLLCAWLLIVFTFGHPESEDIQPLLPEPLLSNGKVLLRLSILLIMAAALSQLTSHPKFKSSIGHMLPFCVFALWALMSTAWSPLRIVTLGQAVGLLTLVSLAWVIAIKWNGERSTSAVLYCVTLGTCACCILLLLCRLLLPETGAMSRDHGGLFHPTGASATASLGLIFVVSARLMWGWRWARRLWLPASLTYIAVLVLSTNRLALALTLGLTIVLLSTFANRVVLTATIVTLCVLTTAYLVVDPGFELAEDITVALTDYGGRDQSAEELSSFSGRHEMWQAIGASFNESPWIGHGYFVTSSKGELYVWYEWGNWTAHNLWLQLLVTTGIIGTVIFAWGIVRFGFLLLVASFSGRVERRTAAFLTGVAVWYLCWGLLNESVAGPLQAESVIFYVCVGIAAGAISAASGHASERDVVFATSDQ